MTSKRMQAISDSETLYKSDGHIWEKAFKVYDAPHGTDFQAIEEYFYYCWGFVGMPRSEVKTVNTIEELRAQLGDLRSWRIEGVEKTNYA